jgi:gliding motility-associated-like protein
VSNQYGCKNTDNILINARTINNFNLGNDSGTCSPNSITINGPISLVPPNNYVYSWNTSPPTLNPPPATKDLIVSNTGNYVLTVINGPCILKDSIKMEFLNKPIVKLPKDTNICGKNLYNIQVKPNVVDNSLTYFWSDGTSGPVNNIQFDGTYILLANNKYCSGSDTIKVESRTKPVLAGLGSDKEFCSNETINLPLTAATNFAAPMAALWLPSGQTGNSFTVSGPGTYIVRVQNGAGCEVRDTLVVKSFLVPIVNIPDSLFICGTGNFSVNASCGAQSYLWSNGSKDSIITISESGYYNVTASNGKCKSTDNLFVDKLGSFTIGQDFEFCPENENPSIEISNKTDAFAWFSLSDPTFLDKDKKRKLVIKKAGTYMATITKGNCTLYDTIEIKGYKNYNMFIPNSFSPNNGDEINKQYYIKATDVKDFSIKVLTRFGEILYESSDVNFRWDGKSSKGEKLMPGAYIYSVSYKSYCSGDEQFKENGILNIF